MPQRMRPLEESDIGPVVELSLRAWAPVFRSIEKALGKALFHRLHPDWHLSQRRAVEAACRSETTSVWVRDEGRTISGFVAIDLPPDGVLGEIHMLAVDPEYQGNGIGTAMTAFAVERIKAAGKSVAIVETGADPGHAAARRTYEKTDFRLVPVARYFKVL